MLPVFFVVSALLLLWKKKNEKIGHLIIIQSGGSVGDDHIMYNF